MPKKKKVAPKFKGELAEPISLAPLPSGASADLFPEKLQEQKNRNTQFVKEERIRKLGLLARHYGLDQVDPIPLLINLCMDYVPGFRVEYRKPSAKGRPKSWSPSRQATLVSRVDRTMKAKGCNQRDALWHLIKTYPEYRSNTVPRSHDTIKKAIAVLEARLSEARRGLFAPVIKKLRALGLEQDFLDVLESHGK